MVDMVVHVFFLTLLLFASCKATITTVSAEPYIGSPTSCRPPSSTFCGVEYSVPDVIATLVNVLEGEIRGLVTDGLDPGEELDNCRRRQKEILCAQMFPKCVDNSVVLTSTANCEQNLRTACPNHRNLNITVFCGLENATVPLETCSPLSTFTSSSPALHYCDRLLEPTSPVTLWMFKLIQFRDLQLQRELNPSRPIYLLGPQCADGFARYFCQLLGECTQDSSQMRLKNTMTSCEGTLNCYDDFTAGFLESTVFMCDEWLKLDYPDVPASTKPSVTLTTSAPGPHSTSGVRPGGGRRGMVTINPEPHDFPDLSGTQTVHAHLMICLLFVVVSALVLY